MIENDMTGRKKLERLQQKKREEKITVEVKRGDRKKKVADRQTESRMKRKKEGGLTLISFPKIFLYNLT